MKHSKYKNSGIIFELLSKQIVNDILTSSTPKSAQLLKKYFNENTELGKELQCYNILLKTRNKKDVVANKIIEMVQQLHSKINKKRLNVEKYNLIREIKSNYNLVEFFNGRINDYKLNASIYKLFEASSKSLDISNYEYILESLVKNIKDTNTSTSLLEQQDSDVKKIALKLIIENFNEKYKSFNVSQRELISRYINENTSLSEFKNYVLSEALNIKKTINSINKSIKDESLIIKLKEVSQLLNEITSSKIIRDEHVSALVKYYSLIDLLKK